jgi:1-acyl-sn-glycerol-3-phosphate acyltransferase
MNRTIVQQSAPRRSGAGHVAYSGYCLTAFTVLAVTALGVNLFVPGLRRRRAVASAFARLFFKAAGIRLTVDGRDRLPSTPCVVVANHASYLDGVVACASLPPEFAFVIKKEMVRVPLAGLLLRRLGSEFVERFDRRAGASDARRVLKTASAGQSLVFFPEGTFNEVPQVGQFLRGAFATAARANMPIVAVAIHGTRDVLPAGTLVMLRRPIKVEVLDTLVGAEARADSRELIARAVGEPLA